MEVVILALLIAIIILVGLSYLKKPKEDISQRISDIRVDLIQHVSNVRSDLTQQITMINTSVSTELNAFRSQLIETQKMTDERIKNVIDNVSKEVNELRRQFLESQKTIAEQLSSAATTVSDVQRQLGELSEATERIIEVGIDLQEAFKPPTLRGKLGETMLENLLSQMLPKGSYQAQYRFRNRETVDFVVFLKDKKLSIDAKFPYEKFSEAIKASDEDEKGRLKREFMRVVKKHIEDISSKYICPDEGTFDFAFMYIPSESVYYEVVIKCDDESIIPYAWERHVIPVSPNTLYAYLQVIVIGLKGLEIEERAKVILEHLQRLGVEFAKFKKEFKILGSHIKNAWEKYYDVDKELVSFESKLSLPPKPDMLSLEGRGHEG